MNPEQLSALFAQHRPVVLGAGAAAVAGLALWQKKKKATGTAATGAVTGATVPTGTIPAAGVVSSSGVQGAYPNTAATDVYNALEPTLAQILSQQSAQTSASSSNAAAPAPVASTLFAPTWSGNYMREANGDPVEVESDGSVFHLADQWMAQVTQQTGKAWSDLPQMAVSPGWYSASTNIQAKTDGTTPGMYHFTGAPGTAGIAPVNPSSSLTSSPTS